jgi:hypothetical protein
LRGGEEAIFKATGYRMILANKPFRHNFMFPHKAKLVGNIPHDVYVKLKDEFEKDNFYLRSTNTVCEVKATGIEQFPVKHATVAFAGKYQYSYTNDKQELKQHDLISAWLVDPDRRQYDRLVFRPDGKCEPNEFNSYTGYVAARHAKGDSGRIEEANKLLTEIILNLANGSAESANYIHSWICDLFQNPRGGTDSVRGAGCRKRHPWHVNRPAGRKEVLWPFWMPRTSCLAHSTQLEDKMFIHLEELLLAKTLAN